MNKVWFIIIIISFVFGFFNGNTEEMLKCLFDVPKNTISNLFKIGSMLVIYNGMLKIAIKANVFEKFSKIFSKYLDKIFINLNKNVKELISTSIICNLLGLGPANMTIALKIVKEIENNNNRFYNLSMYLIINISSLCILPLNLLTIRSTYLSDINIPFIYILFIGSFVTTLFAIFLVKVFIK